MAVRLKGPWSESQIDEFLQESVFPLRLACTAADGFPRVVSVWFRFEDGRFYCVSHRDSPLVALLRDSNKVGFEVAPNQPPYCGVRGQGLATLDRTNGAAVLAGLADRYLGTDDTPFRRRLMQGAQDEVALVIRPTRMMSWDYRKRMK